MASRADLQRRRSHERQPSDTKLALKQSQSVRLSVAWIGAAGFEVFKVDAKHAKWSLFVRCAGPLQ